MDDGTSERSLALRRYRVSDVKRAWSISTLNEIPIFAELF